MRQALLALALLPLIGSAAFAQDMHYGAIAIANPTNVTIHYQMKWGEYGTWKSFTLEPGDVGYHAWPYSYANEDRSPIPYVRFDGDLGPGFDFKEYSLKPYAVAYAGVDGAKLYTFVNYGGTLELISVD